MEDLKLTIGKNIGFYRKRDGLTQAALAAKLNYTDKAVSKWERGESIPDVETLRALALLFGISVDELISTGKKKSRPPKRKWLIPLLSCGIVWLLATIVFVFISLFAPTLQKVWLAFIYALPACAIICVVFSAVWKNHFLLLLSETFLIWSIALAIYLTISYHTIGWVLFLLPIPLQVMALLWFFFRRKSKPKTN